MKGTMNTCCGVILASKLAEAPATPIVRNRHDSTIELNIILFIQSSPYITYINLHNIPINEFKENYGNRENAQYLECLNHYKLHIHYCDPGNTALLSQARTNLKIKERFL